LESLDEIIMLMKKFTYSDNNSELDEQDAAPAGGVAASTYPTVTKWETGLARSVANTLDAKVTWSSLYKITRGKGNTLI
jgi:hypothetical protein